MPKTTLIKICLLAAAFALAGCQSSEERAEGYFRSGLALLEQGDEDRALVEFRNVFKYNGFHKEARKAYADILLRRGEMQEAYGQYLRLIEHYPDTVEVRQILAEAALDQGNWDELGRHGTAALSLAPEDLRSQALGLAIAYRDAVLARDFAAQAAQAERAERLIDSLPESMVLRRIVIDHLMNGPEPQRARPHVESALALAPESYLLHTVRLQLLGAAEDAAGIGAQLQTMVALFPDRDELKQGLLRWYMAQKDLDGAEAFLRAQAGSLTGDTKLHLTVVQFLNTARGRDAGRAELERLAAANDGAANADMYRAVLATMDFEDGRREAAIASLESILASAARSDQTRFITVLLARLLDATDQKPQAANLVARVLEEDSSHVDALKLRATWAISEDRAGQAIIDLRAAQSQAPRDPQIMTLLAAAFERDGSMDLAGEQLAKAVEASGSAPDESLRYARFLRQQGRAAVAETVLADARRVSPGNLAVLGALAEVLLEAGKWPQVQEIADLLRQSGQPEATQAAQRLQAAILLGQNRVDEGLRVLEEQALANEGDARPTYVVVSTQVRAGKMAEARQFLDTALAKSPDSPALRLLSANLAAIMGDGAQAEEVYRALIAENPQAEVPVRLLYGLLLGSKRPAEAAEVLDAGLKALPDNPVLLWIKASALEAADDFDGAIAVYERLYALDSTNVIVANNLSSMISTHRQDVESLERAQAIARRLRGSTVPAFQDTYGWIEYRRGNIEEALSYLEPAAQGMPNDPLVQFHLGMVYADLGRKDAAIGQLRRALELGEGRKLPQLQRAQERLAELTAAP